jgi:dGTPase
MERPSPVPAAGLVGYSAGSLHGYDDGSRARRFLEPPKRAQRGAEDRDAFARDRARVLHSSAFRRLADKTQVVDPGTDDFPRTRLTHSLEVAQIARELGHELGCDPEVVDTAGLAHDLGHPPFGHNGEAVLDALSQPAGGFEGNAQTLRILTRLEPKTLDDDGAPAGLNLTRAVLDATCKYPWPRRSDTRKFGVYADDLAAFAWLRDGVPDGRRCLEAQVMDWADDVAYSVHDVEDGVYAGSIRLERLDASERAEVCALTAQLYLPAGLVDVTPGLEAGLDRLLGLPALLDLRGFDRSHAALAAAKRATSELTGRFVGAAVSATRAQAGAGPLRRYDADLSVPDDVVIECALLKAIAARYVMQRPAAEQRREVQRVILRELVEALNAELTATGASALSPAMRDSWTTAADDAARLRVVIDEVAQLTDSGAVTAHRRLTAPPR